MLHSALLTRDSGLPSDPTLHIHLIAIGGTGMAPLAALLAADGHRVTGSDLALYPPMSELLAAAGIEPMVGFDAAHLEPEPDLVIVGNAVPRHNPEAVEVERRGLRRLSMPEALARFFLADRRPLVVTGTHGKTTTTALAAWVWSRCGADPGFLVGGIPLDLGASFRRGGGPRFILEGDEYNASYFDRGPKFLHYRPEVTILTSVEHDHADLYPTPDSFRDAFRRLVAQLPANGLLVACGDSPEVRGLAAESAAPVCLYGEQGDNDVRIAEPPQSDDLGTRFVIAERDGSRHAVRLGMWGIHNVSNALAVWVAARHDGLPVEGIADAFAAFRGVRRRQEIVGRVAGVTVIDDFAHHPTAVGKTLGGLRSRFPGQRLLVAFEPRSLTAGRSFFRDGYLAAFGQADVVVLAPVHYRERLAAEERLEPDDLARALGARGVESFAEEATEGVESRLLDLVRPGDVVVTMSSGSFAGLPRRLVERLTARGAGEGPEGA